MNYKYLAKYDAENFRKGHNYARDMRRIASHSRSDADTIEQIIRGILNSILRSSEKGCTSCSIQKSFIGPLFKDEYYDDIANLLKELGYEVRKVENAAGQWAFAIFWGSDYNSFSKEEGFGYED